jgi:2-hydroxychromene-2-carboxylate isomerase
MWMWRDLERICFDLDLPFRRPQPFPQNSLLAARVALIGLSASWGEEFCRGVFRAEFGECRQIDNPTVIADILSQLHIESAPVLEAARTETNKAALRTQTGEAEQLGIFGAPSFTTADGELFWGNDRLEGAIAWAKEGR